MNRRRLTRPTRSIRNIETRKPPTIDPRNKEGGCTYPSGLTFEEWAIQMNTASSTNRLVNKFGLTMSAADEPIIFPESRYSSHASSTGYYFN